jgi:hypothetical protein
MNCTGTCRQGRIPCPTPWTCSGYEAQANYERVMSMPIQFVGEEPPEPAPVRPFMWRDLAVPAVVIVVLAAGLIWLCHL